MPRSGRQPQVLNVAALERGEALLTGYHGDLSTDETLYVLRLCLPVAGQQDAGSKASSLPDVGLIWRFANIKSATRFRCWPSAAISTCSCRISTFAIRAMREAITIAEQEHLPDEQAKLLQSLGPMYAQLEQHDTALSLFERACAIATANRFAAVRNGGAQQHGTRVLRAGASGRSCRQNQRGDDHRAIARVA